MQAQMKYYVLSRDKLLEHYPQNHSVFSLFNMVDVVYESEIVVRGEWYRHQGVDVLRVHRKVFDGTVKMSAVLEEQAMPANFLQRLKGLLEWVI